MIVTDSYVNSTADKITVNFNLETSTLNSIKLQTSYEYLYGDVNTDFIDLNYLIDSDPSQDNIEILASDIDLNNFYGIFYIRFFYTKEGEEFEITALVYNLNNYKECIAEYILKSNICSNNLFKLEPSCSNDSNIFLGITGSLLIENIYSLLDICDYTSADLLYNKLIKLCNKCNSCKEKDYSCNNCK